MGRRLALVAIAIAFICGCSGQQFAPKNLSFESYDEKGKVVKLSELQGKVVVLDFWATWCGPCREFFPFVREIHEKYKDKGLQVVALTDENRGTVESFEKKWNSGYPVFLDTDRSVNDAFQIEGYPTMVVLGKSGEILFEGHPAMRDEVLRAIQSGL